MLYPCCLILETQRTCFDNVNTSFGGNPTFDPPTEVVDARQDHRLRDLPNQLHGIGLVRLADVVSGWLVINKRCRDYFVCLFITNRTVHHQLLLKLQSGIKSMRTVIVNTETTEFYSSHRRMPTSYSDSMLPSWSPTWISSSVPM